MQILTVLREEHVHATFFVVGRAVQAYPSVVRREVEDGNAVGNHTWSHGHLVLYDQTGLRHTLERTDAAIFAATRRSHAHHAAAVWRSRLAGAGRGPQTRLHAGDVVGSARERLGVSAGARHRGARAALRRRRLDHRLARRKSRHRLPAHAHRWRASATAAPTSKRRA